jgi:hypothetical protein
VRTFEQEPAAYDATSSDALLRWSVYKFNKSRPTARCNLCVDFLL